MSEFKSGNKMVDTLTFSFFEDGQELGTSAAAVPTPVEGHSSEEPKLEFNATSSKESEVIEDSAKADNDTTRYQYHQSRADKLAQELEKLKPEYEQLKTYAPIARYLSENPQALTALETVLSGNPQPVVPATPAEASVQVPAKPTKPSDYNKYDAYNNEESASYKYREANEAYQEQMLEYVQTREIERDRMIQEQMARQQYEAQQAQQLAMTQQKLMTDYGYSRAEALEFVETFSKPEMFTMENLVKFHKTIQGKSFDPKVRTKEEGFIVKPEDMPLPAGTGGSESPKKKSDEEKLNEAFLTMGKQRYF